MKAFIRKIRSVKKRKLIKDLVSTCTIGLSFRYGAMQHKTKPSPFFVNSNQSNQHVERLNPFKRVMIVDDENQSSIDNPSIHRVKLGSGITLISKEVNKKQNQISEPLKSTITQKSELTYSQDEIDALGLGEVNKEVSLVVGLSMPHSSQSTLAVHEKNWNRLIQESNVPIDMEQEPKILMSRTSADLTNQKWIKEFICSLRAGSDEEIDEALIKSILGKVSESELDVPSINKILKSIANATLSVASNQKLMRILVELQKPIPQSPLTVTPSTEVVKVPAKLEEYQQESKSSSSIFAEAWMPQLPRHRSADSTRCYGQSQNQQNTHQPDGYSEEQIQSYRKNPRYSELAQDPQLMGQECSINPKSEEEACTVLQAENEGLVTGAERTDLKAGDPNYDYKTTTPTRFIEIKVPRNSSLKDAARLGRKSGLQQGNDGDVTLLVNLMRIQPEARTAYAKTFLEAAGGENVIFINN